MSSTTSGQNTVMSEQNTLIIDNHSELRESPLSYFAGKVLEFRAMSSLAKKIIDLDASFLFYSFFNARSRSMMACATTTSSNSSQNQGPSPSSS